MNLEQDYLIYSFQAVLSVLSASSVFFLDSTKLITFASLIPITVLLGYTAHISRDQFRSQTSVSLIALIFVPVGGAIAAISAVIPTINILTSVFASGKSFKDYYRSTSLPLLFTGLLAGALLFTASITDSSTADTIQNKSAEFAGEQTEIMFNRSNMMESTQGSQTKIVNQTTETTYSFIKSSVMQEMGRNSNIGSEDYRKLENAFENAENTLDDTVRKQRGQKGNKNQVDVSQRISDLVRNSLKGKNFIFLVPAMFLISYTLQPITGILVGLWATIFARINQENGESTESTDFQESFEGSKDLDSSFNP